MRRLTLTLLIPLLLIGARAEAYFDRIEIGAKGLALGGAYAAGVDDVSAAWWNPGALGTLPRTELMLTHSRPYVVPGLAANSILAGMRAAGGGAAFSWHRMGLDGALSEDLIGLSFGRWVYRDNSRTVHFGGTAKLAVLAIDDEAGLRGYGSKTKLAGDLGVLWEEGAKVRVGAVLRHLGEPTFDFIGNDGGSKLPGGLDLAVAYHWRPESTIHFGRSDMGGTISWNYAGEIWFYEVFAIRAGIYNEEFSGGFGLRSKNWAMDASFLTHQDLGNTYRASLHLFLPEKGTGR